MNTNDLLATLHDVYQYKIGATPSVVIVVALCILLVGLTFAEIRRAARSKRLSRDASTMFTGGLGDLRQLRRR